MAIITNAMIVSNSGSNIILINVTRSLVLNFILLLPFSKLQTFRDFSAMYFCTRCNTSLRVLIYVLYFAFAHYSMIPNFCV